MDNAKDFFNYELQTFFENKGIQHETSSAYTPPNKMDWEKGRLEILWISVGH